MIRIVADDKISFLQGVLEPYADMTYIPGAQIDRDILTNADALLIRTRTKCTESLLKGTSVRFISTATIGFDHIDTRYCENNKIKWTNAPGCNSSSVQQYIAAALLKIALDYQFTLKDKTIGIIGVGNVGSKVEKLAKILGMKVLLNDPPRARREGDEQFIRFESIINESDVVTIHVPLNIVGVDKTYHLFNEKVFKKMKKGTWFINTSRGEVMESYALKAAIKSGRLGGAVIDVWENEPDIDIELMEKVFLATPHIAGYSSDGKANGTAMIVNELSRFFNLPLNDWYPQDVPEPQLPYILIDGKGKNGEEIVKEAINHTYNISEDDLKLRFSPSDFEKQRGDYPLRREFSSFEIKLKKGTKKAQKMLEALGFNVKLS
jgi:erythronate-4-phosphate dehydrogenase